MGLQLATDITFNVIPDLTDDENTTLVILAMFAEDDPHPSTGMLPGMNSYPSIDKIIKILYNSGIIGTEEDVRECLEGLVKKGWIREHETNEYRKEFFGVPRKQRPTCYQINTTMLTRVMDVNHTIRESIKNENR